MVWNEPMVADRLKAFCWQHIISVQLRGYCCSVSAKHNSSLGVNYNRHVGGFMQTSLKQIEEQALGLNSEDRAKLAEVMLESLSSPLAAVEEAWAEEIEKRIAAYDRGEIPAYAAEDVFAEAKRIAE